MPSSTDGLNLLTKLPIPDLTTILDDIDFEKKPISHGAMAGGFGVNKWGSFIVELIAYPNELERILEAFGLTQYQYSELRGNPLFEAMYKDTESSLKALANNGGYQLSARRLAEQGLSVLEEIMRTGEDKDRLKAVELSARLSNLDPLVQAKQKENAVVQNTGVQLVVNFGQNMPVPDAFKGKGSDVILEAEAEVIDEETE